MAITDTRGGDEEERVTRIDVKTQPRLLCIYFTRCVFEVGNSREKKKEGRKKEENRALNKYANRFIFTFPKNKRIINKEKETQQIEQNDQRGRRF